MNIDYIQDNLWIFIVIFIWELIWKGFALWKSAKNDHKIWFVSFLFINTVGIIPIIYLIFFQKQKNKDKRLLLNF